MTRHVTIGPEFFAKAKYDYADWKWAIIREFFQNSMDCGSSRIEATVETTSDNNTILTVANNGKPMTEEIIVDKLLSLGGSAKNFQDGNTGGFGKAKEILYFCHDKYTIMSGDLIVDGRGSTYEIITFDQPIQGTISKVVIRGEYQEELLRQIDAFINYAQWSGTFVINGAEKTATLRKGSPRLELEYGTVYVNTTHPHRLIVRINGIPMFTKPIGIDKCVLVELKGASDTVLTSNRDSLRHEYSNKLTEFITQISVDSKTALRRNTPEYIHYEGDRLIAYAQRQTIDVSELVSSSRTLQVLPRLEVCQQPSIQHAELNVSPINHNFIIKNMVNMKVPSCYDPGSGLFSEYSKKLTRIWGRILVQLHRQFLIPNPFSVGFIFDSETEAQYENHSRGEVYYLNPCHIVTQATGSRSFSKRFKLTEKDRLITIAAHELVHGMGFGYHDERYANKLTDVFMAVMQQRSTFNWCFK